MVADGRRRPRKPRAPPPSPLHALPPRMARRPRDRRPRPRCTERCSSLAVLAGAFIAMGAVFATTVTAGRRLAFGVDAAAAGLTFSLGLILVVVARRRALHRRQLIVMAWAARRVSHRPHARDLGAGLSGELRRGDRHGASSSTAGQYALGGRRRRRAGAEHRRAPRPTWPSGGVVLGVALQRARVPRRLAHLQRALRPPTASSRSSRRSPRSSPWASSTASPTCTSSPPACS